MRVLAVSLPDYDLGLAHKKHPAPAKVMGARKQRSPQGAIE
jgi:hypothetical protein